MLHRCLWLFGCLLTPVVIAAEEPVVTCAQHLELYGAKTEEHLQHFRDLGVTQVILESNGLIPVAEELGLRVVQANWWNPQTDAAYIQGQIKAAGEARRLVSLNLMDEPIFNDPKVHSPEFYQATRKRLREEGNQLPLSITMYGPKLEWNQEQDDLFYRYVEAVDVLRIDPYPVVSGRPLRTVYDWSQKSHQFIARTGRPIPLTVILQAWSPGDNEQGIPSLPEVEQLRVMAYLALFSGTDTVSFFSFDPAVWDRKPGFRTGFAELLQEIQRVQQEFAGVECTVQQRPGDQFLVLPKNPGRAGLWIDVRRLQVARIAPRPVVP